jgi:hypothetical protein
MQYQYIILEKGKSPSIRDRTFVGPNRYLDIEISESFGGYIENIYYYYYKELIEVSYNCDKNELELWTNYDNKYIEDTNVKSVFAAISDTILSHIKNDNLMDLDQGLIDDYIEQLDDLFSCLDILVDLKKWIDTTLATRFDQHFNKRSTKSARN